MAPPRVSEPEQRRSAVATLWAMYRAYARAHPWLVVLGVFGEYLGRMYMEGKHRPLFIIAEVRRHPVAVANAAEPGEVVRVAS